MANAIKWVNVLAYPEHRLRVVGAIEDWYKQCCPFQVLAIGNAADGRLHFFDVPTVVVNELRQKGISLDTQPRDPKRPIPTC